jgi:hypothetical protein
MVPATCFRPVGSKAVRSPVLRITNFRFLRAGFGLTTKGADLHTSGKGIGATECGQLACALRRS